MTRPKIGKLYADGERNALDHLELEPSVMRTTTLQKLLALKVEAFDRDAETCVDALLEVMDWHRPWQFWEQVFAPRYVGERYLGPGCRSCGPSSMYDCMTVRGIASKMGVWDR